MSGQEPARRLSWAKTFAVASLAAAASLALFVLVRPGLDSQSAPKQLGMIEPPPGAIATPMPPQVAQVPSSDSRKELEPGPAPAGVVRDVTPRAGLAPRPRATNAAYVNNRGGGPVRRAQSGAAPEVATEFIPLVQAGPYAQAEEGHLVRVELPRSALASFGLPVNAEAPSGRVKADVLLGQDGVARAIRFVR